MEEASGALSVGGTVGGEEFGDSDAEPPAPTGPGVEVQAGPLGPVTVPLPVPGL